MLTKAHWIHFPSIDSTNDYLLQQDFEHGTIITADSQQRGKGRKERKWKDVPKKSFLFSLGLYIDDFERYSYFSLVVALCVVESLYAMMKQLSLSEKTFYIKWPNDVLMRDESQNLGKLAGILIETQFKNKKTWKVVVGIGLNWSATPSIDEPALFPPVALFSENVEYEPLFYLDFLIQKMNELSLEKPYSFESYKDLIHRYHFLMHRKIRINTEEYVVENIDNKGYLRIRNKENQITTIKDWDDRIVLV
ncbi:MAG: biotin--[acetyl-CoA-carboxylase] ligase [Leptospiraceae bacterium]|nr:biotin--[acetyl-CoA-carboxylase] ligase [Leptospiraceae bacterium]MDW7975516.1 biotin--[acetyl-CoA-carboxylase] ligase [Leptospiraceae bacterium]